MQAGHLMQSIDQHDTMRNFLIYPPLHSGSRCHYKPAELFKGPLIRLIYLVPNIEICLIAVEPVKNYVLHPLYNAKLSDADIVHKYHPKNC